MLDKKYDHLMVEKINMKCGKIMVILLVVKI